MQKAILLTKRPGPEFPQDISLFELKHQKILNSDELEKLSNPLLIKVYYFSIDPVMRVWMSGAKTYLPSLPLNEPIFAFGIGEVQFSKSENFKKGDIVIGALKMQEYCLIDLSEYDDKMIAKIPILLPGIPLRYYLNIIGINGFAAYQGLIKVGQPKPGETVVVSTAAGATGIFVCQFAKNLGCKVVGLTSSDEKCQFLIKELGIDSVINYKTEHNIKQALKKNCPKGIDIYFDNVGEDMLDAVLANMNIYGRIALSGATKIYNNFNQRIGLKNYSVIIHKRLIMRGFTYNECFENLGEVFGFILRLINEKKLVIKEEILDGLEKAPLGLQKLFLNQNVGKILIKVDQNFKEKNDSKL